MERYGIKGKSLQWYKSYLYHRDMRVKCRTSDSDITYSEPHLMEYGPPQGSCLGPLLFTIFTNDLSKHLLFTKCILFADDTTLYMSHNNEKYLTWCIEVDLKIVNDWFKANLLTLNIDKSVCVTFQSKRITGHNRFSGCNVSIENKTLLNVTKMKFLGVWLDNRLTWTDHLITLFTKIKQNANLLRHGRSFLNIHANKCLYYTQIYSHLTYGFLLWGNMISTTNLGKLQKLQNKCFKYITKEESTVANFHKHKLLQINELKQLLNWKHCYKLQHAHLPSRVLNICNTDSSDHSLKKSHHYNTRHKSTLNLPQKVVLGIIPASCAEVLLTIRLFLLL